MSDQVWLNINPGVDVGIDRGRAMAMTEKDFADLYFGAVHVLGRNARKQRKRESQVWAAEQIAARAALSEGETA